MLGIDLRRALKLNSTFVTREGENLKLNEAKKLLQAAEF